MPINSDSIQIVLVWALLLLWPTVTAAQDGTDRHAGAIAGVVVDAVSQEPLPGATVAFEPLGLGVLTGSAPGDGAFVTRSRVIGTDDRGRYRFGGLTDGTYRLRIEHIGYRPAVIEVELRAAQGSDVSVGLAYEPVALEPLGISAHASDSYGRSMSLAEEVERGRVGAVLRRQGEHLVSDVRTLSHADVLEAVTLGETDLFRALQRLPGVTGRDDYSAAPWIRGASVEQTRIYFDGLPLYNPMHGLGILSAVSTDAVGGAFLHPGVQPVSLGGGAAGALDIQSRSGGGDGSVRGLADLSLASTRLALDQEVLDGRAAWILTGRRSYADWLVGGIGALIDEPTARLPYAFSDLTGRFDYRLDGDRSFAVSGILERDRVMGDLPDVLHGNDASWGNAAGRITYAAPIRGVPARHTIGVSRYTARVRERPEERDWHFSAPSTPELDNALTYGFVAGEFSLGGEEATRWSAGYRLVAQSAHYDGPGVTPYSNVAAPEGELLVNSRLLHGAVWTERRWQPVEEIEVRTGLRLEAGKPVENGGATRLAPRLSARFRPTPELSISAGLGRSYQYEQAVASVGPALVGAIGSSRLWLLAGDSVPATRSDIATLGAEYWLGRGWLASANVYLRQSSGVAVPDPTPGPVADRRSLVTGDRGSFVTAENRARGLELSARRLAGRWTASVGYSITRSDLEASGYSFRSPEDRRHALDATGMIRIGSGLRLGAAYTYATGAPYTRVYYNSWSCQGDCEPEVRIGEPAAGQSPPYSSLDLLLDWMHSYDSWGLGFYLQVHNALFHDNPALYTGSTEYCAGRGYTSNCDTHYELLDQHEAGLPILPLLGFRVRF